MKKAKCLSYTLAMNIADDADKNADPITNGVLTYTLPADEEGSMTRATVQSFGLFRFITTTMLKLHLPAMVLA